jgi:hypothetical protein
MKVKKVGPRFSKSADYGVKRGLFGRDSGGSINDENSGYSRRFVRTRRTADAGDQLDNRCKFPLKRFNVDTLVRGNQKGFMRFRVVNDVMTA